MTRHAQLPVTMVVASFPLHADATRPDVAFGG